MNNSLEQQKTNIIGIEKLDTVNVVLNDDTIHIIKQDDKNGLLLSYKTNSSSLKSIFITNDEFSILNSKFNDLKNKFNSFIGLFSKKESIDAKYELKTNKEDAVQSFITKSGFESTMDKYAKDSDLREKEAMDRKETIRLAEEMTDFAGAAMVGINQSSSSIQSTETPTEGS